MVGAEAEAVTVWDIGSAADDAGAETSKTAVAAQDQAVVAGGRGSASGTMVSAAGYLTSGSSAFGNSSSKYSTYVATVRFGSVQRRVRRRARSVQVWRTADWLRSNCSMWCCVKKAVLRAPFSQQVPDDASNWPVASRRSRSKWKQQMLPYSAFP